MKRKIIFIVFLTISIMIFLLTFYFYREKSNYIEKSKEDENEYNEKIYMSKIENLSTEKKETDDKSIESNEEIKEFKVENNNQKEEDITILNNTDAVDSKECIKIDSNMPTNIPKEEIKKENITKDEKSKEISNSNVKADKTTNEDNSKVNDNKEEAKEQEDNKQDENKQEEVKQEEVKSEETKKEEIQEETTVVEKSIYDYEFNIDKIKAELISIGQGMGLTHITEDEGIKKTPNNSSWSDPVRASIDFQGKKLERTLKDYVSSMPILIKAYGGGEIKTFTIYVENNGNGNYTFYFLY